MADPFQTAGFGQQRDARSRVGAAVLSVLMLALMVLAILTLGLMPDLPGRKLSNLTAIDLKGNDRPVQRHASQTRAAKRVTVQPQPQPPQPVPTPQPVRPPVFIQLSREEFAAADISRMPKREAQSAGANQSGSDKTYGPGEGPGGARLYNAEWVREPSRAELAPYFTGNNTAGAWATIACRTIERNHVENCQELDESPPGSGLARALRRASWQFLVRPPRIEGKPLIGGWVRIRFDFTRAPQGDGEP